MKLWRYIFGVFLLTLCTLFALANDDMVMVILPNILGTVSGKGIYLPIYLLTSLAIFVGVIIGVLIEYLRNSNIRKVFNENNIGHYSLAVGEAEFFGSNLWEQILTWTPIILYIGPFMDIVHWQKFDIRAYIPHIALLVLITIIYFLIKRIFFRRKA